MRYNAIIVAGGRSSRLGGTPKALLSNGSLSLLQSTLEAVADADYTVVVGPADLPVPQHVLLTREEPAFGGPAAALSTGARVLASQHNTARWTLVLSVDMPAVADALPHLLAAAETADSAQGLMGETDGVLQPLAGIYRTEGLIAAAEGDATHRSVRSLLKPLNPEVVQLPSASTADVDTWEQAHASGFDQPGVPAEQDTQA